MTNRRRFNIEERKSIYIKNKILRREIIQLYHNILVVRYKGK